MTNLRWAKTFVYACTVLIAISGIVAAIFWPETSAFLKRNDEVLKLIGYGLGPAFAVMGFFWGLIDKAELKDASAASAVAKQQAAEERRRADDAVKLVDAKVAQVKALEKDLETVADAGRIWKLRDNAPFPEYKGWKYDPRGAKIVTIALFKGGVGKSHLAANFAAYTSEKRQKPVLLIDLDYQGSLSTTMLIAAELEPAGSLVDSLFDEGADFTTLTRNRIHLANHGAGVALNDGKGLGKAWIVPADYTLPQIESRMLIRRVLNDAGQLDERYRLAHILLHPDVRREFSLIIIDTPPRMTLGTVNALVSSHAFVVPTIFDRVSSEAVRPFLSQVMALKADLNFDLDLAGVVGTMTRRADLSNPEPKYRDELIETVKEIWGDGEFVLKHHLPRKTQVTSESDLGYFLDDDVGALAERFYDPIFDELWKRIFQPQNHANHQP